MKASVVEELGRPLVMHSNWPDPECERTDAVIRVEANGICLTDHHIWHGGWPWAGIATPVPIVLGHEYCGVVEEVGSAVQGLQRGDRVVVPFNHSCGVCEQCHTREFRTRRNGARSPIQKSIESEVKPP